LNARSVTALQGLAWVLATNPDAKVRNGTEAVSDALLAAQTDGSDPIVWDTLAAAYAEIGRFDEAVKAADKAIDLATIAGYQQLAGEIQTRRQLYAQGNAFRDNP
jgi:protein O-mannosyl-transferase